MFGLSNYSIKKILPRLIIVAIAINTSFYICAAIVDLSNIIGANVGQFIAAGVDGATGAQAFFGNIKDLLTVGLIVVIIICTSGATILLSIFIILVLISLRTVVLTLLIVISPIAFALYLLPNTENLFKKWLNEFVRMLLVYPMLSAVFGACILTHNLISTTSAGGWLGWLINAVLILVPVAAIMPIMKMSGQAMGALSGAVNNLADRTGARRFAENADTRRRRNIAQDIQSGHGLGRVPGLRQIGGTVLRRRVHNMETDERSANRLKTAENAERTRSPNFDVNLRAELEVNHSQAGLETAKVRVTNENGELSRVLDETTAMQMQKTGWENESKTAFANRLNEAGSEMSAEDNAHAGRAPIEGLAHMAGAGIDQRITRAQATATNIVAQETKSAREASSVLLQSRQPLEYNDFNTMLAQAMAHAATGDHDTADAEFSRAAELASNYGDYARLAVAGNTMADHNQEHLNRYTDITMGSSIAQKLGLGGAARGNMAAGRITDYASALAEVAKAAGNVSAGSVASDDDKRMTGLSDIFGGHAAVTLADGTRENIDREDIIAATSVGLSATDFNDRQAGFTRAVTEATRVKETAAGVGIEKRAAFNRNGQAHTEDWTAPPPPLNVHIV